MTLQLTSHSFFNVFFPNSFSTSFILIGPFEFFSFSLISSKLHGFYFMLHSEFSSLTLQSSFVITPINSSSGALDLDPRFCVLALLTEVFTKAPLVEATFHSFSISYLLRLVFLILYTTDQCSNLSAKYLSFYLISPLVTNFVTPSSTIKISFFSPHTSA